MNITDKQYKNLSNEVYNLDPGNKKYNPSLKEEVIFRTGNTNYKILKAEDTPNSGMQVRTVGAIKGGEVGKSHIIIVYAGIDHLTAI
ncbi:hypothetical protein KVF93_04365 [Streptococcus equi subsp. zooepidemicus]|uniref:Uncharacterized protein n=1 Tax=Streptococcus equi subsp. zooepidemicus (strain MGCS10565) TaxID=552526 RepID=B4U2R5_STREM|nr:hypothetical protein [Streptococcus equi]ACG62282.1 hypothetical protein Sez_0924 [Streptococcus equi subsp. zooepidemicus MGCS10565]MCD3390954.1 hypothetical protein [Streptococcus equi subsp. zooepidemicus]MCD3406615.1 hypothetical protein [Streptococcus equi subsp. zooepidemicus]MCD3411342.1 hypothetical protein [Streptococcus equi subsp. zooepidemicus]MCD3453564.1 hypothetical protein [Streptococcus equi subsp. zooepidemicus]